MNANHYVLKCVTNRYVNVFYAFIVMQCYLRIFTHAAAIAWTQEQFLWLNRCNKWISTKILCLWQRQQKIFLYSRRRHNTRGK